MQDAPPTGHTKPILQTTGQCVKFKDPVSTKQTYNTTYTPHQLNYIETALTYMIILDTGSTIQFITTRDSKLSNPPNLGSSNKMIVVADNTVIHVYHKTRLPYNLPPSVMEGNFVLTFHNSLIGTKLFADAGCIRIFHPHQGGFTIHHQNNVHIK